MNELKTCAVNPSHVWMENLKYCPYCNISPDARIEHQRAQELERLELVIARHRPNSPAGREILGQKQDVHIQHTHSNKTSYLYFIKSGDFIKIGITSNIQSRVSSIQTSSALPVEVLKFITGGRDLERKLHNKFNEYKQQGEWFQDCKPIRDYIENLPNE